LDAGAARIRGCGTTDACVCVCVWRWFVSKKKRVWQAKGGRAWFKIQKKARQGRRGRKRRRRRGRKSYLGNPAG